MIKEKDRFSSRWGFILSCIGSAVGMGNLWRFPILVLNFGGLTFLIPYFIFVVLISLTGVIEEMALGRATGSGPIGAFGTCTEIRTGKRSTGELIGIIPALGSLALAIGYSCVVGWIVKYLFLSFNGSLFKFGQDMNLIVSTFDKTTSQWGNNGWLIFAMAAIFTIMIFGIAKGIELANKIMMPILFALLLGLGIYIATLSGSENGYKYILTLNPKMLINPKTWIYAFGQAFFSLSIAGSGTVIYGSYLSKDEDIPAAAKNVAIFDTLASILATLVIIPAMGVGGAKISQGGPGLMFIHLVKVINGMPGGKLVGIFFFVCIFFAGASSLVNLYETPIAALQEKLRLPRTQAVIAIALIGTSTAVLIQHIVSPWMDAVSIYICPLGALLAAIMFLWVAGKEFAIKNVNQGAKKLVGAWFYPLAKYVFCTLSLVALVAGAILGGIG